MLRWRLASECAYSCGRAAAGREDWTHMLVPRLLLAWHRVEGNYHRLPGPLSPQNVLTTCVSYRQGWETASKEGVREIVGWAGCQITGLYKDKSFPWKKKGQEMLFGVSHLWWRMEKCGMLCWRNFRAVNECNESVFEMKDCKKEQNREKKQRKQKWACSVKICVCEMHFGWVQVEKRQKSAVACWRNSS